MGSAREEVRTMKKGLCWSCGKVIEWMENQTVPVPCTCGAMNATVGAEGRYALDLSRTTAKGGE